MASNNNNNPWKGLNFYVEGEIIYGRDSEILSLSHYIFNNTQTVLYGRSGIGKSSILNAGIFPEARQRGIIPIVIRLKHEASDSYIEEIKKVIIESGIDLEEKLPSIDSNKESIWEFMHRHVFRSKENNEIVTPLLVFDQFEEIFTLQNSERIRKDFFSGLADLLNDVKPLYIIEKEREMALLNTDTPVKTIETSSFKGVNLSLNIKNKSAESGKKRNTYLESPSYHIVFVLREDFLSFLEIYAASIPVMRNNRFALQTINEEQAAEIIMKPKPGLVSKEVAKLIIEKVTGRSDFEIDGIPEIEVSSAILSLYLSRLYSKMVTDGKSVIDQELVENHSADIIEDFYSEATQDLSEESIEWLEDTLINSEGRRDNRDKMTVLKESKLSEEQLNKLIEKDKILRQFSYAGNLRIEFIHDVLCPVVIKHRRDRNERIRIEELRLKTKKEKRSLLIKTISIASVIVVAVIFAAVWLFENSKSVQVLEQQQNLVLSLNEDKTVKDTDFWRALLSVTGMYNTKPDTVLFNSEINKTSISNPFTINTDSCSRIRVDLDFGDFVESGKYINQSIVLPISSIMDAPFVKLNVSRDLPDLIPYKGRVLLNLDALDIPLENAIVVIGDNFTFTDSVGSFEILMENKPDNNKIIIAKGGLGCIEDSAIPKDSEVTGNNVFRIMPQDSLKSYHDNVTLFTDSITDWDYSTVGEDFCANVGSQNGIYTKFKDGHEDRLKMYWIVDGKLKDQTLLRGYFYFINEKKELDKNNNGKYAYYFGSGSIDSKVKKDDSNGTYRNYEFMGYDAAGNLRKITGKYYVVKDRGKYAGDITTSKKQIASFGRQVDD